MNVIAKGKNRSSKDFVTLTYCNLLLLRADSHSELTKIDINIYHHNSLMTNSMYVDMHLRQRAHAHNHKDKQNNTGNLL